MTYRILTAAGELVCSRATLEQVVALIQIDRAEIEWAIEEEGQCDTADYSVVANHS